MALDLNGKRVAVIGGARSGIGAAKLVKRLGGYALVSDTKPAEAVSSALEELRSAGIEMETGEHRRVVTENFDLVVLSPGVVPKPDLEQAWQAKGIPVWSELELSARASTNRWIGVTGSNGKTTTVHLIADMLKQAGMDVMMAGNVGTAWSGLLPAPESRVFVVEVSSFQLETSPTVHPHVAVLLNLYENHLDRHGTMDVYAGLKAKLFRNQTPGDVAVFNGEDIRVREIERAVSSRVVRFGLSSEFEFWAEPDRLACRIDGREQALISRADFPLIGHHNALNAAAASAAAYSFGADLDAIRRALKEAKAVEHRIEYVTTRNGVAYYNDSKSTNMVATMTALNSFQRDVILLFGGRPKKESFAPLATRIPSPVKKLIIFGEALPKLHADLPAGLPLEEAATMEAAVSLAQRAARDGDTVLLSPGCTSFDEFNNFEERGRIFKALVKGA
ncbi:MAG TPA: UDP-N-acetylmuramoyl-L-alanine--D-glutamate ligase [bacterium]|jgi:UDP-N-acetylmuramoylalanine--D-glutamate ligase